jgi:hypothetical protein
MQQVSPNNPLKFVTLMDAAITARVHVSNMYRLRNRLGAVKRDGVWYIPAESLRSYIQRRTERARRVLATSPEEVALATFAALANDSEIATPEEKIPTNNAK